MREPAKVSRRDLLHGTDSVWARCISPWVTHDIGVVAEIADRVSVRAALPAAGGRVRPGDAGAGGARRPAGRLPLPAYGDTRPRSASFHAANARARWVKRWRGYSSVNPIAPVAC
jgi:hypothetical protein